MYRLLDLSHPFWHAMPVYPGDESVSLTAEKVAERDGFTAYSLTTGLHAGTHLDAPLHFLAQGAMVKDLPLDTFMGPGVLLDVRGQNEIGLEEEYRSLVQPGDIVLLWTNHSEKFGGSDYYGQHPVLSPDLASFFIRQKIRILGMDLPSPDGPPFTLHKQLLTAGIPLLENLTNLKSLAGVHPFEVMAFPLKIRSEGCPVRVVAKIS